jgi:hypothetical protein
MVRVHSGEKIEAKIMVIGGEDIDSRRELGIVGREFSHYHDCMVCKVHTKLPLKGAYIRFMSGDSLMMLPFGDNSAYMQFVSSPCNIQKIKKMDKI